MIGNRTSEEVLYRPIEYYNKISEEDFSPETIRILALGESTTDIYFADDRPQAWTVELESILNQSHPHKRFKIFNEGIGGTKTALIIKRLDSLIKTYRPHIVISMMGVNDEYSRLRYEERPWTQIKRFILQSKTITLIAQLFEEEKPQPKTQNNSDLNADQIFNDLVLIPSSNRDDVLDNTQKVIEKYPHLGYRLNFLAAESIFLNNDFTQDLESENSQNKTISLMYYKKSYEETLELLARPSSQNPLSLYTNLIQVTFELGKYQECALAFSNSIKANIKFPPFILGRALHCFEVSLKDLKKKNIELIKESLEKDNLYINESLHTYLNTVHHYKALYWKLKEQGIKYVAVGYPFMDISVIKRLFSSKVDRFYHFNHAVENPSPETKVMDRFNGIIFVENKVNFEEAVKANGYYDVFKDKKKKTFGHTTVKGDTLIAKSIYKELSPLLDTLP
jgi:hypothetical protein